MYMFMYFKYTDIFKGIILYIFSVSINIDIDVTINQ